VPVRVDAAVKDFLETLLGTVLVILLIGVMAGVATLLGGCPGPTTHVVPVLSPVTPACVLVIGPPEPPPMTFRSLSEKCRHPDGTRMRPDDPCMSSEEVSELARFAAVSFTYAVTAWRACSADETGIDPNVRVIR